MPLLAAAQTAMAPEAAALWRETQDAVQLVAGPAGALPVRLNQAALREGEAARITIDVPRPGYLNLISVNGDGATVLFPNRAHRNNKVGAGLLTVPTPQMPFELRAGPPFGTTLIAAFLTDTPLDWYGAGAQTGEAAGPFVPLSVQARAALNELGTRGLLASGSASHADNPVWAGMTLLVTCAASGPCPDAAAAATSGTVAPLEKSTALAPGILLEAESKDLVTKFLQLRDIYDKGIKLTKVSEGFVPHRYDDSAGYCTIAYGHLIKLAHCDGSEPPEFLGRMGEPEGGQLLIVDMSRAQRAVMGLVKVQLTDGQYAALCDFTFNAGAGKLRSSTLLKVVNAGQHDQVPLQLRRWALAGGKVQSGLLLRREREIAIYFDGKTIPVPKALPAPADMAPVDLDVGETGTP